MIINDVICYPVRVPLLHPFKASYGIRDTADFVLVKITTDDGIEGWGEASTIPIYDEGSQADVVFVITHYFAPLLRGENPTHIAKLMLRLDKAVKGSRYAKCAIDFALHDICGKYLNIPVYRMLGGSGEPLDVCWVLSAKSVEDIEKEAEEKKAEGYRSFKLKVGTDHDADVNNLKALRKTIGEEGSIRLDGNEGWNPKEALDMIRRFLPYTPEHLEQPVPARDMEGLRFVKDHSILPIVADECILTPYDAMKCARFNAADRLNIKVSRDAGILSSRKIAAIAQAASIAPFAGSNLELGLGTMASAHFFSALPDLPLATELVGPLLLKEDILEETIQYQDGKLLLSDRPGFGVTPDMEKINKYLVH